MNNLAEILEEELEAEAQDPCNGKTCTANEHCCNGHVCVDTDESKSQQCMKTPKIRPFMAFMRYYPVSPHGRIICNMYPK